MGEIYWRGKALYIDVQRDGLRVRKSVIRRVSDAPSEIRRCEKMAADYLGKLNAALVEGRLFDIKKEAYNPKFWRLAGMYWRYHLKHKKSGAIERSKLNLLLKDFGCFPVLEITQNMVSDWTARMKERLSSRKQKFAVATINRRLAYLRRVFNYAAKNASLDFKYNPAKEVEKLRGETVRQYLVSEYDFEKILSAANPWFKPLLIAAWETGCRPEELYSLKWPMVDMMARVIYLPSSLTKTGSARTVPMSARLLKTLLDLEKTADYVFLSQHGRKYVDVRNEVQHIRSKLGTDFWFRDMRRGFVTRKVTEGHDYFAIMAVTGHKTISTFKRYNVDTLAQARAVVDGPNGTVTAQPFRKASNY